MEEKVVVIIISPIGVTPYCDETALWDKYSPNGNEKKSCISLTANGLLAGINKLVEDYSFVLINQCQEEDAIKKILKKINNTKNSVIAWTHETKVNNHLFTCNKVEGILNGNRTISCESFKHIDIPPPIKVMQNFVTEGNGKKTKFMEIISDCIKKKTTSDIHSLRSQILTPFVALHLVLQDSVDEKEKPLIFDEECEKCCGNIRGLDKTLEDFLENVKNATEKQKTDIKGKYDILKGKIDGLCEAIANNKTTELAMCIDLIGVFADELEKAVEAAGEK